jgi:hypothetical protein
MSLMKIILLISIFIPILMVLNNALIDLKSKKILIQNDENINVEKVWSILENFNSYKDWNNYIKLNYTINNNNKEDYNLIGFFEDSNIKFLYFIFY